MAFQTLLLIKAPLPLSIPPYHRLLFHKAKPILLVLLILIYSTFLFVECEICFENGLQSMLENEACDRDSHNAGLEVRSFGDKSTGYLLENELVRQSLESICSDSNLFCFPSTLPGYFAEDDKPKSDVTSSVGSIQAKSNLSWSSDYSVFKLSTGQAVSCSSNSQSGSLNDLLIKTRGSDKLFVSSCGGLLRSQGSLEVSKQGYLDGAKVPHIEVSPPKLDWGQNSLYAPSLAFLNVANTHSDSNLFLYESFSTNSQFYPCNFSEVLLKPGEVATICFVFLPTWLGISTAHLVMKTSSGGFLVEAKGFGVESPYRVQLSVGPTVSSLGKWNRNLSLFNPFDDTLSVEEVIVWVSVPLGSDSYLTKTVCKLETSKISNKFSVRSTKEWLDVKNYQVGMPLFAMRPPKNWIIAPGGTEMIIDLDFIHNSEGNAFGAFCAKLERSSQGKSDTIVVPLDADLNEELTDHLSRPVSASLETLPNGADEATVFSLSLRNSAPYLLNVIKIGFTGEGSELFQIKYSEGLMLFPSSVTQVAVIDYVTAQDKILDQPSADMNLSCSLTILTNDSMNPQVEVHCNDIVTTRSNSDVNSRNEELAGKSETKSARIKLVQRSVKSSPLMKVVEEPDELVLENWKSQATASGLSILDHDEVIYPVVQVGTHHSKWITVRNPSPYPVLMQLILNSAQIVGECKEPNGFSEPASSSLAVGEYALQTRCGFSIAKTALTDAYVLPYESASFGPVVFHPTKRCGWRSSALIRNNLSGVEWVYLGGLGGSFSLSLFEGSNVVQNLEFKFNLPSPLNLSLDNIYQSEDASHTCSTPLLKELYAKNTGDMPLHVRRIEVSGAECGLDGFSVHACKGFSLQPGESSKLLISYRPDFSSVTVQRDLELALGSGIIVIPMKASLPLHMFFFCKKSMFWTRLKKISYLILFAGGLMLILFFYIPPLSISLASPDYFTKSRRSFSLVTYNKKYGTKFYVSSKMNGSTGSVGKEKTLVVSEQGMTAQQVKPTLEYHGQIILDRNRGTVDESKDGKLTVKVGKEKGRRRKKNKGSVVGLTGIYEVSSSHSGNSTPSSPSSPLTSFTPKRLWSASSDVDQFVQKPEHHRERSLGTVSISKANNMDRGASVKSSEHSSFRATEKPSPPMKMPGKPVLLQSATFPSSRKPSPSISTSTFPSSKKSLTLVPTSTFPSNKKTSPLISTSTIAPHARAPGSKLNSKKADESEAKTGFRHQFEYDIWGDHLFGCQPIDRSKKSSVMTSTVMENRSDSFFVSGPQTLCSFGEG